MLGEGSQTPWWHASKLSYGSKASFFPRTQILLTLAPSIWARSGGVPPRTCVLVSAPTNAQVDNLLSRVHDECYNDTVFRDRALGDHPAPFLRPRGQRATAAPGLASFDQLKVHETLGNTPSIPPGYRKICDIPVTESASSVHKHLNKETRGGCPQGALLQHFASLAKHVVGNVVLLRTNTYSIVTSSSGMDKTLTRAAICTWT